MEACLQGGYALQVSASTRGFRFHSKTENSRRAAGGNPLTLAALAAICGALRPVCQRGNGLLEVVLSEAAALVDDHVQAVGAGGEQVVLQRRRPKVRVHHVARRPAGSVCVVDPALLLRNTYRLTCSLSQRRQIKLLEDRLDVPGC